MKRDWEIIRQVLIAVEDDRFEDYLQETEMENKISVLENSVLLVDSGFLNGKPLLMRGSVAHVSISGLTWEGHDLLDTIRSKPVWENIKTTALEKGLELTFDVVKALGVKALAMIVGN